MRVLVTGGVGFVGRHLVPLLLERGHEVAVLDALTTAVHGSEPALPERLTTHARVEVGDIRDPGAWGFLPDVFPDVVIHLAAETGVGQSMYEIGRYTDVNIQGTATMLEALRDHCGGVGRVVLASSRAVYGEGSYDCGRCGLVTPMPRLDERLKQGLWEPLCPVCGGAVTSVATTESAQRVPTSVYAMTKAAQEDLIAVAAPALGASTGVLRYSNVYGEGQPLTNPYTGVLSAFALRLVNGEPPIVYEDGLESRDFIHVHDVALATARAAEAEASVVVNVGSGERWSLSEVARRLSSSMDADPAEVRITGQYRLGDIRHFTSDVARFQSLLGIAEISLADGLARFAAWVREAADVPDQDVATAAEEQLARRGLMGYVPPERGTS